MAIMNLDYVNRVNSAIAASEATLNASIALKADAATTYSKTEVDAKAASLDADITAIEVDLAAHEAKTSDSVSTAPVHCTPAEKAIWNAKLDTGAVYTRQEVGSLIDEKVAKSETSLRGDITTLYARFTAAGSVTAPKASINSLKSCVEAILKTLKGA